MRINFDNEIMDLYKTINQLTTELEKFKMIIEITEIIKMINFLNFKSKEANEFVNELKIAIDFLKH